MTWNNEIVNMFQVSTGADMRDQNVCSRLYANYRCD